MKKLLLPLLLAFCGRAFSQTTATDTANSPVITFEKTNWTYPEIPFDSGFRKEFVFKNTGKSPLIISNAQTSCGCDDAMYPREPVMPEKTGIITYIYDTERVGAFTKSFTVTSNAKNGQIVIQVHGSVAAPPKEPEANAVK